MNFKIREISSQDKEKIKNLLIENWNSVNVVSRGTLHDASTLPGFAAEADGQIIGFITFRKEIKQIEIVTLNSFVEAKGIGTALINAVRDRAIKNGVKKIWLITTNDNIEAIRFYQRRGFNIAAIHKNAIDISRKLKPEIPIIGLNGIPIKDEIEFELFIQSNNKNNEQE